MCSNKKIRNHIILCIFLTIFLFLWIFPIYSDGINDVIAKSGYLDGSWKVGLNWATVMGLKFGKDIVFQYGPFYFLSDNSLLNISRSFYFSANIFSAILFLISIFLLLKLVLEQIDFSQLKNKIFSFVVIILTAYAFLNVYIEIPEILLLLALLLIFNLIDRNYSKNINLLLSVFVGFLLSVLSLVKFYYFFASLTLVILSIIFFIIRKKSFNIPSLVGSFIVFFVFIWLIIEKSLSSLFLYIKNGFALTFGYSESLQLFFEDWQGNFFWEGKFIILYTLLLFVLWIFFIAYGAAKKNNKIISYFVLSFPILFLVFKQGFTRMDHFHTQEYFRFIIFLLIFTLLFFGRNLWKIFPIFLIFIIIALPYRTVDEPLNIRKRISYNLNEFSKVVQIINPSRYMSNQVKEKEEVKNIFANYADITKFIDKNDTVDIFPFEIIVPYVYDLKWDPRPLMQSVTVYNKTLNELDANHFKKENSPEKIIYRMDSIDKRYSLFDEPLVFIELLKNYSFTYVNDQEIGLLEKCDSKTFLSKESIKKLNSDFDEVIEIPKTNSGYLFCNIDVELNTFGRIKNLLYKGDYIYLTFYFYDPAKEPITVRFIRENAKLGFFIQNYIPDIYILKDVFLQKDNNKYGLADYEVKAIKINSDNSLNFTDNIDYEFYRLKFD